MEDQVLAFFFLSSLCSVSFFIFHSQVPTSCCSVLLMLLGICIAPSTLNSKSLCKKRCWYSYPCSTGSLDLCQNSRDTVSCLLLNL